MAFKYQTPAFYPRWTDFALNVPNVPMVPTYAQYMLTGESCKVRAKWTLSAAIGGAVIIDLPQFTFLNAPVGGLVPIGIAVGIRQTIAIFQGTVYLQDSGVVSGGNPFGVSRAGIIGPTSGGSVASADWNINWPFTWQNTDQMGVMFEYPYDANRGL